MDAVIAVHYFDNKSWPTSKAHPYLSCNFVVNCYCGVVQNTTLVRTVRKLMRKARH